MNSSKTYEREDTQSTSVTGRKDKRLRKLDLLHIAFGISHGIKWFSTEYYATLSSRPSADDKKLAALFCVAVILYMLRGLEYVHQNADWICLITTFTSCKQCWRSKESTGSLYNLFPILALSLPSPTTSLLSSLPHSTEYHDDHLTIGQICRF